MSFDHQVLTDIVQDLSRQQDRILLDQLGDLVKAGLIVLQREEPMIVEENDPTRPGTRLIFRQKIRFELRDQEYIDTLKKENAELKAALQKIRDVL